MKAIKSILIVGGGTAGWMTAAYFSMRHPEIRIKLIESSEIPTVSVGESTNPITRIFHDNLRLCEKEFMQASNATYKIAIKFENFSELGKSFYHPFDRLFDINVKFKAFADSNYLTTHMSNQNRFDKRVLRSYGYQVDAGLYGQYLKAYAIKKGVVHKIKTINNITLNTVGEIESVEGDKADLYIDCTGFRSLLLGKTIKEHFISIEQQLLNDRAIAVSVPYVNPGYEMSPFTRCTALSAGWVWDIPLWNRRGTGYVYSSKFLSESEAELEFRNYLGFERVKDLTCRHIKIRHGRFLNPWTKNCVAIGLSAGFIEPLESTGLALAQRNIMDLATYLINREAYNKRANSLFDTTVDFIMAHYILTLREDTEYWRYIKYQNPVTANLSSILEAAGQKDYKPIQSNPDAFYHSLNWNVILSGMGFFSNNGSVEKPGIDLGAMPLHYDYLKENIY